MIAAYREDARRASRVEIIRDRCFWRVLVVTDLIGDGGSIDFGLHTSRSVAEHYAERLLALLGFRDEWPAGADEETLCLDQIATAERELELYAQTWREWDRYFDDEERVEIQGDEDIVRRCLESAREELDEIRGAAADEGAGQ